MCPACIGSTILLLSGAGSAGGVSAMTLRWISRRRERSASGDDNDAAQSRAPNAEPFAAMQRDGEVTPAGS